MSGSTVMYIHDIVCMYMCMGKVTAPRQCMLRAAMGFATARATLSEHKLPIPLYMCMGEVTATIA